MGIKITGMVKHGNIGQYVYINFTLLRSERGISLNNKKIIIILIIILITVGVLFYNKIEKETLNSTFSIRNEKTDINTIWVGTFQLVWNELMDKHNGNIEFENGESELATELNKRKFTKDMLSETDYYIVQDETTQKLKETILYNLKSKFNIQRNDILQDIDFKDRRQSYTLYAVLNKKFTFKKPFDKLPEGGTTFNGGNKKIQLFGINNSSSEELNNNVRVMFFNKYNEFAVKIDTMENEELILYRTDNKNSLEELYNETLIKELNYGGSKKFEEVDELRIPYIELEEVINYNELCNRTIKNTNGMYIKNAIQNIKFSLTEKGGNLVSDSESSITYLSASRETRAFNFTNTFVLFLKEKDKEKPYFALKIYKDDILIDQQ